MLVNWEAEALNTAPDSKNEIHGDVMAREFGFKGGLVPGVTISAYLVHPAVAHWGEEWLARGSAEVRVSSPLYDGEQFEVRLREPSGSGYVADLIRPDGTLSASAKVALPAEAVLPPVRRHDPLAPAGHVGPKASFDVWRDLRETGCRAFRYVWDGGEGELKTYLRDVSLLPPLLHPGVGGYANMSFLLGCSNWILASNAYMNPWVHLETHSQNYAPVPRGTAIIAEMGVVDFYEKKGHQFIDVEVALYDEATDRCYMSTSLRAIFRLRGAE